MAWNGCRFKLEKMSPDAGSRDALRWNNHIIEELPRVEREYLSAMVEVMNEDRVAKTADIAEALGKSAEHASQARNYLVRSNIVYSPKRGELMLAVPYLDKYLDDYSIRSQNDLKIVEQWKM